MSLTSDSLSAVLQDKQKKPAETPDCEQEVQSLRTQQGFCPAAAV